MTTNTIEARAAKAAERIAELIANLDKQPDTEERFATQKGFADAIAPIITAEMAEADEVESALAALREKYPSEWCITIDSVWSAKSEYCEEGSRTRIGLKGVNQHFMGDTLAAALDAAMKGDTK